MVNLDLFESANISVMPTVPERVQRAVATVLGLFRRHIPVVVAFSGGKDSATCLALVLIAARTAAADGLRPLVVVTTSDTRVENPEISLHYRWELDKAAAYGKAHGFSVITKIVQPTLASSFQLKVLTGRGVPSFAGTNTDCSVDLKQTPQISWRNKHFRSLKAKGLPEPVTVLGLRYDESERRRLLMLSRRDSDKEPSRNAIGDLVLSILAWWQEDDVWEFLGEAADGAYGPVYSDFAETRRIYAHSSGTTCAVVADAIASGKRTRGGCGARHGCWVCQQSEDKSLQNMLEFDDRYEYMAGLFRLNQFIRATRYDWMRRHWVGRTIQAGYIAIEPDTYHPTMVRELARYMMQLDYDEVVRTRGAPRFTILPEHMLAAIDASWSLNGLARPFAIWKDYRDIRTGSVRYDVPDVPTVAPTPMPPAKFLYVGEDWDASAHPLEWTGLRDSMIEGLTNCAPDIRQLEDGRAVWDLPHDQMFDVDVESVCMLLDFELDRMVEIAEEPRIIGGITAGYKFYAMYGTLQLSHSQVGEHDMILRRTAFKDRNGLTLEYDVQDLRNRAIDFRDLPAKAREVWANKGTAETAQTELDLLAA